MHRVGSFLLIILIGAIGCSSTDEDKDRPQLLIAVAANVAPLFDQLIAEWPRHDEIEIIKTTGSSGVLMRQAQEGAPFDLFFSADLERVEQLAAEGVILPDTVRTYAEGRLVMLIAEDDLQINSIENLNSQLPIHMRIAIANPQHAPYGKAAKEALTTLGQWEALEDRFVYGENVMHTLQFARSGNVGIAFVPLSLMRESDDYMIIDRELHSPILQGCGVLARSEKVELAREFQEYVLGEAAGELFQANGYRISN